MSDITMFRENPNDLDFNPEYVFNLEKENEELEEKIIDLKLDKNRMLVQVKNRMPLEIANRVDSWPRCLSAVAQLKTERNNADVENEELKAKIEKLEDLFLEGVFSKSDHDLDAWENKAKIEVMQEVVDKASEVFDMGLHMFFPLLATDKTKIIKPGKALSKLEQTNDKMIGYSQLKDKYGYSSPAEKSEYALWYWHTYKQLISNKRFACNVIKKMRWY